MAYSIDTYSGSRTFTVEDGTINNSLDLRLIGKNYAGYGEVQNENFVHILENFAGSSAPPKPLNGQIWYDTTVRNIKVWDSSSSLWRTTGGTETSSTPPTGVTEGTLWWDDTNKQLFSYDGNGYVLIGPQTLAGLGTTEMQSLSVSDNNSGTHAVIAAYIDDEIVYIISASSDFTLSDDSATFLGGRNKFDEIKPGINLNLSSTLDYRYHGKAADTELFDGRPIGDFVTTNTDLADFIGTTVRFGDSGFTLGNDSDLEVKIDVDGTTPIIGNQLSSTIKMQTRTGGTTNTPLTLVNQHILPGTDNETDLGSATLRFRQLHATQFFGNGAGLTNIQASSIDGLSSELGTNLNVDITGNAATATTALQADTLLVSTGYLSGSYDATPNTIAARTAIDEPALTLSGDTSGSIKANYFVGTATAALFADLAEKYLADQDYEVGTVVAVGGDAEVTACKTGDRAFGAVSANPAYMMNSGLVGGTYIALKGRVPVKVTGPVKKGDKLIAFTDGTAGLASEIMKNMPIKISSLPDTFAIVLEDNANPETKLVECIIL